MVYSVKVRRAFTAAVFRPHRVRRRPGLVQSYEQPLAEQIARGVSILRRGGVVAYPTDTLYGLGADITQPGAVEQVFEIKDRPQGMPLPVLLPDPDSLSMVSDDIPPLAWTLAHRFWPGPLTLVVPRASCVPAVIAARGWTVAVRVPDHPVPRELSRLLGSPITGTSANWSGGPSPHTAEEVRRQLGDRVDLIIEGGPPPVGRASTVLDITQSPPRILRLGAISWEDLSAVWGATTSAPTL